MQTPRRSSLLTLKVPIQCRSLTNPRGWYATYPPSEWKLLRMESLIPTTLPPLSSLPSRAPLLTRPNWKRHVAALAVSRSSVTAPRIFPRNDGPALALKLTSRYPCSLLTVGVIPLGPLTIITPLATLYGGNLPTLLPLTKLSHSTR